VRRLHLNTGPVNGATWCPAARLRALLRRSILAEGSSKKTLGELVREVGPWEGEHGADLDALFVRQRGNRRVPELP
jgi:hypothetical protein